MSETLLEIEDLVVRYRQGRKGVVQAVVWRSDVWGAMVAGLAFDYELPAAEHLVTMTARDALGRTCVDTIELVVE